MLSIHPNPRESGDLLRSSHLFLAALLPLLLFATACSDDEDPLNELQRFRIMAIKAEPPAVQPGDTAVLSALAWDPEDRPLTYSWSLCPVPLSSFNNYECPIDEDTLREQLEASGFPLPPFIPISFDLGDTPTVELPNLLTEDVVEALCEALEGGELPEGVPPLSCEDGLLLYIRLEVQVDGGEAGSETAVAIKELPILIEPDPLANTNPPIEGLLASEPGDQPAEVEESGTTFRADTDYELLVLVDIAASESFVSTSPDGTTEPRQETLFITWFITGGSTDTSRTSFIDGELPFEDLLFNEWTTPKSSETNGEEQLFIVLQDDRGGVEWLTRTVRIEDQN